MRFQIRFLSQFYGRVVASLLVGVMGALMLTTTALAQDASDGDTVVKMKVPKPEDLSLKTKDGVNLKATYYAGTEGKKTVPIIIVHDFKGNRNEYAQLALFLQSKGHAVIVPDLRGHGGSTKVLTNGGQKVIEYTADKMRRANDFAPIVKGGGDLETIKSFLRKENNKGALNIDRLCVIGAGMGSILALNWAYVDWSWPLLATGKQGQDVHGLVLVSPPRSFKGITTTLAMKHPGIQSKISTLIIVGDKNSKALADAKSLYKIYEKYHIDPPKNEIKDKKDLFLKEVDTTLQGTKLLTGPSFKLHETLAVFIQWRLVDKDFPWNER